MSKVEGWSHHGTLTVGSGKVSLYLRLVSSFTQRVNKHRIHRQMLVLLTHAWHHSIHVWLLDQSSCSTPFTKELHDQTVFNWQDYISSISSKMANASQKYSSPQQHFFRQAIPLIKTKTQFFSRETNVVHSLYLERRF